MRKEELFIDRKKPMSKKRKKKKVLMENTQNDIKKFKLIIKNNAYT